MNMWTSPSANQRWSEHSRAAGQSVCRSADPSYIMPPQPRQGGAASHTPGVTAPNASQRWLEGSMACHDPDHHSTFPLDSHDPPTPAAIQNILDQFVQRQHPNLLHPNNDIGNSGPSPLQSTARTRLIPA